MKITYGNHVKEIDFGRKKPKDCGVPLLDQIEALIPETAEDYVLSPQSFTESERYYMEALMKIYTLVHNNNPSNTCCFKPNV